MAIIVTGGAGFIGSNFVIDWLSQSDEVTNYYSTEHEQCIFWKDPTLNIEWNFKTPILSNKDNNCIYFYKVNKYV